jgi:hypothetical protein
MITHSIVYWKVIAEKRGVSDKISITSISQEEASRFGVMFAAVLVDCFILPP